MTIGNSSVSCNMASGVDTEKSGPVIGVAGCQNEAALLALMERTGYQMIQVNLHLLSDYCMLTFHIYLDKRMSFLIIKRSSIEQNSRVDTLKPYT